jgi:hypothetical protein
MKIIFLLDDQQVIVTAPEDLQLRQIDAGLAAIIVPAGKNEAGIDLFRSLLVFPVTVTATPIQMVQAPPAQEQESPASPAPESPVPQVPQVV